MCVYLCARALANAARSPPGLSIETVFLCGEAQDDEPSPDNILGAETAPPSRIPRCNNPRTASPPHGLGRRAFLRREGRPLSDYPLERRPREILLRSILSHDPVRPLPPIDRARPGPYALRRSGPRSRLGAPGASGAAGPPPRRRA